MFIKLLERIQLTIGILFLLIFFVTTVIQVVNRYLGVTAMWTEDVATYSFIWAVLMGASVMLNKREHFQFDILLNKLKGKKRKSLYLFNDTILLLFCGALFYYGIIVVDSFWDFRWESLPEMKMGYVWISIPIMAGTMVIYTAAHMIRNLKSFNKEEAVE
ncbi:TRAP transporter small permease [Halobacillus sp. Marseille-Q1614]|uniref:TRAP transporter small permease n=1 Tax=Halobacillus sp. Marseille-Q1614 TaxID=2709134 RepID=UPI00156E8E06|nr:TRAP transporter small permease [Halobacillus sp. Marseille-Q1614]